MGDGGESAPKEEEEDEAECNIEVIVEVKGGEQIGGGGRGGGGGGAHLLHCCSEAIKGHSRGRRKRGHLTGWTLYQGASRGLGMAAKAIACDRKNLDTVETEVCNILDIYFDVQYYALSCPTSTHMNLSGSAHEGYHKEIYHRELDLARNSLPPICMYVFTLASVEGGSVEVQ